MADFDFTSPRLVLTGTLYGEARSCGRAGMEDVAACIFNRVKNGWNGGTVVGVCLAPRQFSCWNAGDPNRAAIIIASTVLHDNYWQLASIVADNALAGRNPGRIGDADSYFARSMPKPPYWAVPPAVRCYSDGWHDFWRVAPEHKHDAPSTSVHSTALSDSDRLNQSQLDSIGGQ